MKFFKDIKLLLLRYFKINKKGLAKLIFGDSKLQSRSYTSIIDDWVAFNFVNQIVIVLTNINVQVKNIDFWAKIPVEQKIKFMEDVVILRCKDKSEMMMLIGNIGQDFAEAKGYIDGELFAHNLESYK